MTIKLPRVGETVDEVYLVAWNKAVGDVIAVGDDLMEVEDEIKTGEAIAVCESN